MQRPVGAAAGAGSSAAAAAGSSLAAGAGTGAPTYLRRRGRSSGSALGALGQHGRGLLLRVGEAVVLVEPAARRRRSASRRPRAAARPRRARGPARRGSSAPRRSRPPAGRTRGRRRRADEHPLGHAGRLVEEDQLDRAEALAVGGERRRGPVQAPKSSKSRCVGSSAMAPAYRAAPAQTTQRRNRSSARRGRVLDPQPSIAPAIGYGSSNGRDSSSACRRLPPRPPRRAPRSPRGSRRGSASGVLEDVRLLRHRADHQRAAPRQADAGRPRIASRRRSTTASSASRSRDPGRDGEVELREPGPRGGGYGLFLVEQLAKRWGVDRAQRHHRLVRARPPGPAR